MKKAFLFLAVVLFLGVISVPVYSSTSTKPVIEQDDPPKAKELTKKETVKEEKKAKKADKKKGKADYNKKGCDKNAGKSCCAKDKKN